MKESLSKQNRQDFYLAMAAFGQISVLMLQLLLLYGFGLLQYHSITRIVSIVLCAALMVVALPAMWQRSKKILLLTYFTAFILFLLSYLLFPDNSDVLKSLVFDFFAICLPSFICMASIIDYSILKKALYYNSVFIFMCGLLYTFFAFSGKVSDLTYSMSLSYYLLIPALYFFYMYTKNDKVRYLIYTLVSMMSMVLLGSRGAFVSAAIYVVVLLLSVVFIQHGVLRFKQIMFGALLLIALTVLIINYQAIAENLYNWLYQTKNINSRTLYLLSTGQMFSHDSGRNDIYSLIWEAIQKKPLFGYGIGGDRIIAGMYAHNLFLEIICQLGYIFGLLLIAVFITLLIRSFTEEKDKSLWMMFFCMGFIPFMFSGSYLEDVSIWLLIGYCMSICEKRSK